MQNRKRDTDVWNRILDPVGEGEGGMFWENSIKTCILSRVKQIASPGWCMRQVLGAGALGRPRSIRWRGRWDRGSGWEIHVNPWLIHVNVWQKPLQYCEVIHLQLIKINGKKTLRDITLPTKVHLVKAMLFPVVRYGLWDLDYKESWVPKNWCFWTWY